MVRQAAERWRGVWEVLLQYSSEATRLHLALFYFYGIYYQWSKRLAGGGWFWPTAHLSSEGSAHKAGRAVFWGNITRWIAAAVCATGTAHEVDSLSAAPVLA